MNTPTSAPAPHDTLTPAPGTPVLSTTDVTVLQDGAAVRPVRGDRTTDLDLARVTAWWAGFRDQLLERSEELHDVGPQLRGAVGAVTAQLEQPRRPADVFHAMAAGFGTAPGLGTLLGAWFGEFARCCTADVGSHELADAAWSGLVAVERAGGSAAVGSGRVVDAMAPAVQALAGADVAGVPAVVALTAAYRAAADGARTTGADGVVDAGALVVAWFFERGTVV